MPEPAICWRTFHTSIFNQAGTVLRWTAATPRAQGALRYRCPVTGSLVLITDESTLATLARPRARLRCADCGEMHLLVREEGPAAPADIVVNPAQTPARRAR